ncbi:MAG: hypothetical protein LBM75_01235 [Myxococcales bacterium]|nr:hypothetical protein [Myxococcales bacterium]
MKKIFSLVAVLLGILLAAPMMGCGGDDEKENSNSNNNNNNNNSTDPSAAFQQFGLSLDQVKPNVATEDEYTTKYGNKVDSTVYYRQAAYKEDSDEAISTEVGLAYNTRMFDYTKSIAADGKCYTNYTGSDHNPTEVESYEALNGGAGFAMTWSYKYNGMWIDVYVDYIISDDDEIGISLQGAGYY